MTCMQPPILTRTVHIARRLSRFETLYFIRTSTVEFICRNAFSGPPISIRFLYNDFFCSMNRPEPEEDLSLAPFPNKKTGVR